MWERKKLRPDFIPDDAPAGWKEIDRVVLEEEKGASRVAYVFNSNEDISKLQLDPQQSSLSNLLKAGVMIEPGQAASMLNLTDPADLDEISDRFTANVIEYIEKNRDQIVKTINPE
jgi:hypothetical protein